MVKSGAVRASVPCARMAVGWRNASDKIRLTSDGGAVSLGSFDLAVDLCGPLSSFRRQTWSCGSSLHGRLEGISGRDISDGNTKAAFEALDSGICRFVAHGLCDTDSLRSGHQLESTEHGLPWRCAEPLSSILQTKTLSLIGKPLVWKRMSEGGVSWKSV
jgi:hypothetical protein